MNDDLLGLVWDRAASICEYCRVPQLFDPLPFSDAAVRDPAIFLSLIFLSTANLSSRFS